MHFRIQVVLAYLFTSELVCRGGLYLEYSGVTSGTSENPGKYPEEPYNR